MGIFLRPFTGHSRTAEIRIAYVNEWKALALLPGHENINRFLGEFVSEVPDDMFAALTDDMKEIGAVLFHRPPCMSHSAALAVLQCSYCSLSQCGIRMHVSNVPALPPPPVLIK
jgi:hypothetical protein